MRGIRFGATIAVMVCGASFAQVPDRITFSARLSDTSGAPVTGTHATAFSLFATGAGGTPVWTESHPSLSFSAEGLAFAELGTNSPLTPAILAGAKLFLEISVDGIAMSPRLGVVSVPYAIRATEAARVGSFTPAQLQQRVTGTCPAGQAIRTVNQDGSVVCEGGEPYRVVGDVGQPPFENGWMAWGGVYAPPRFYKDALGMVVLEGLAKGGPSMTGMFTLPVGYRPGPNQNTYQIVLSNNAAGVVEVQSNGRVLVEVSNPAHVSLWGIRFRPN